MMSNMSCKPRRDALVGSPTSFENFGRGFRKAVDAQEVRETEARWLLLRRLAQTERERERKRDSERGREKRKKQQTWTKSQREREREGEKPNLPRQDDAPGALPDDWGRGQLALHGAGGGEAPALQ